MKLVWLFQEHRDLYTEAQRAKAEAEMFAEKVVRLTQDNEKLAEAVKTLEAHIAAMPKTLDLFEAYQKQILQEEPWTDGKIPEGAWLSPGDSALVRENA